MNPQQLAAWGVVAFVLIAAAEMPPTSELAVAFTYLILVSVLLSAGATAFANLQAMVNGKGTTLPQASSGG